MATKRYEVVREGGAVSVRGWQVLDRSAGGRVVAWSASRAHAEGLARALEAQAARMRGGAK